MLRPIVLILGLSCLSHYAFSNENGVVVNVLHTYEARIRVDGRVSTTQIKASDAGQAKKLVQQQFPKATVLSVKKID
jgi:hypothetical protein